LAHEDDGTIRHGEPADDGQECELEVYDEREAALENQRVGDDRDKGLLIEMHEQARAVVVGLQPGAVIDAERNVCVAQDASARGDLGLARATTGQGPQRERGAESKAER
jgi:hypothetical protein